MIGARRDERKPQKCPSTLVPRPRVPRTALLVRRRFALWGDQQRRRLGCV